MRPLTHRTSRYVRSGVVVLVATLALAGCYQGDARYSTNTTDARRATRIWNDPWAAPDTVKTAGGTVAYPGVVRLVASRAYQISAVPGDAVIGEIQAAQEDGWELTGADCTRTYDGIYSAFASLTRHGDLDHAATAWVLVGNRQSSGPPQNHASHADETDRLNTAPSPDADDPPATRDPRPVTVTVLVEVPHHLDQEWSDPPTVQLQDTCLAGATPGVGAQLEPGRKVLADRIPGKRSKPKDRPVGPRDGLLDAIGQADRDPTISELGLNMRRWISVDHGTTASAPQDQIEPVQAPPTTLTRTVDQATADGWSLTYTGCWASGLTLAELHRSLTNGYDLALRLELAPDPTDSTQTAFAAKTLISTPTEGGPGPHDLGKVTTPCWAQQPPDPAAPPAFTWAGVPWFGPASTGIAEP